MALTLTSTLKLMVQALLLVRTHRGLRQRLAWDGKEGKRVERKRAGRISMFRVLVQAPVDSIHNSCGHKQKNILYDVQSVVILLYYI